MKEFILNILRGIVIGISNVIPGVSGGTMMVSMGIYDRLILVLTHFVKRFKEAVALLVPIGIGMLLAIAIFAKLFSEVFFPKFPLQTNLFFIGLILGGLPIIYNWFFYPASADNCLFAVLSFGNSACRCGRGKRCKRRYYAECGECDKAFFRRRDCGGDNGNSRRERFHDYDGFGLLQYDY